MRRPKLWLRWLSPPSKAASPDAVTIRFAPALAPLLPETSKLDAHVHDLLKYYQQITDPHLRASLADFVRRLGGRPAGGR